MVSTINNYISQGCQNNVNSANKFTWFKTNFNMPVVDFVTGGNYYMYVGPVTYLNQSTTYDLTGFVPGYEICNGSAVYTFDNTAGGSTFNINTNINCKWTDTSNNVLNGVSYTYNIQQALPAGYYSVTYVGANIGFEGSEIAASGTYDFRASASGTPNITEVVTAVTFNNVPTITTLPSQDRGYVWVEGNNLTYVNDLLWKHSIAGTYVTNTPGATKAGYIWLDSGTNSIRWVGNDGNMYQLPWSVKQFASYYAGSSTGTQYAGTSRQGYLWVDNQFGLTHLAYIGTDGYKYLCGAGNNPYA